MRETTPGEVCSPPTPLPTLSRSLLLSLSYTKLGGSTVQRHHTTLNRFSSAIRSQERQERGSCRSWLSRVVRNERPESKPPDPSHHGFDTTSSQSSQVGSTNFPPRSRLSQHVSTSERLSRNHPAVKKQTQPQATMVSTRPARRANRSAQPTSERAKPVEPNCDEGATRVETTRYFLVSPPPVSGSDR